MEQKFKTYDRVKFTRPIRTGGLEEVLGTIVHCSLPSVYKHVDEEIVYIVLCDKEYFSDGMVQKATAKYQTELTPIEE